MKVQSLFTHGKINFIPWHAGISKLMQVKKCNKQHKWNQRQKSHNCLKSSRKKGTWQNSICLHNKCLRDYRTQYIKRYIEKSTATIILSGEKLKAITPKSEMRQRWAFPFLFNFVLKVIAGAWRQGKEIKRIQIGNEIRLSLFADEILLYIRHPKNFTRRLP